MAKRKPGKKGIARFFKAAVILILLAFLGLAGWIYLTPMLTAGSVTLYDDYTVTQGDIETTLSFSAALAVKKAETHTAAEMSTVKELYVKSGDTVAQGDPLVLLSDGELFTAGFAGVVNEIRFAQGDWVRPNFTIAQVCDLENLQVTLSVDEYDVKSLAVGQSCVVRVISLGMDFETTIAHINRVSASTGTLAYYTVSCDLTVPAEVLPGMRATVAIPDQAVYQVNRLPIAALAFDEAENPYVLIRNEYGAYERRMVETGLSDGVFVEIKGGVSLGDTVYAVSGTESAKAAFTLSDLYQSLFGVKVVINEPAGAVPGGRGGVAGGTDSAFTPPEGFTPPIGAPGGMPAATDTADSQTAQDTPDTQNAAQPTEQSAQPAVQTTIP